MSNRCCNNCKHQARDHDEEPCINCCVNQSRAAGGCEPRWEPKSETPPKPTGTVLEEAQHLVGGDRGADYGHPLDDFTKTATMFNALKGTYLTAEDVALFMMCIKLSRESNRHKRDNLVDLCGYAQTLMMVKEERHRRDEITTTFTPLPDYMTHDTRDHAYKPPEIMGRVVIEEETTG